MLTVNPRIIDFSGGLILCSLKIRRIKILIILVKYGVLSISCIFHAFL